MRSWVALCSLSALLLGAAGTARAGYTRHEDHAVSGRDARRVHRRVRAAASSTWSPSTSRRRRSILSSTLIGRSRPDGDRLGRLQARHDRLHARRRRPSTATCSRRRATCRRAWPSAAPSRGPTRRATTPPRAGSPSAGPSDVNAVQLSAPATVEMPTPRSPSRAPSAAARSWCSRAWRCRASTPPIRPSRSARRRAPPSASTPPGATMYLVAVDGDQAASVGMTAEELADFLSGIGVSDALELDGGGSLDAVRAQGRRRGQLALRRRAAAGRQPPRACTTARCPTSRSSAWSSTPSSATCRS